MKKRVFSASSRDRIEATTDAAVSSRTNVGLVLKVYQAGAPGPIILDLTPQEATRLAEWVHEVDADVWADEMGECEDHELTPIRCAQCGRYCGTRKRCPHCAPRSK